MARYDGDHGSDAGSMIIAVHEGTVCAINRRLQSKQFRRGNPAYLPSNNSLQPTGL